MYARLFGFTTCRHQVMLIFTYQPNFVTGSCSPVVEEPPGGVQTYRTEAHQVDDATTTGTNASMRFGFKSANRIVCCDHNEREDKAQLLKRSSPARTPGGRTRLKKKLENAASPTLPPENRRRVRPIWTTVKGARGFRCRIQNALGISHAACQPTVWLILREAAKRDRTSKEHAPQRRSDTKLKYCLRFICIRYIVNPPRKGS